MKRYIRSTTIMRNAKSVCTAVVDAISKEGIKNIVFIQTRKAGMSGSGFQFTYKYNSPNEEYIFGDYAEKFGQEAAERLMNECIAEHDSFLAIQDITGYTPTEEVNHDPFRGGFREMDEIFLDHVKSIAESFYPDVILDMHRSGLYGIETRLEIKVFLPKQ